MFRIRKLLLIAIFIGILLIAGCGKKECEIDSDCRDKICATASCVENICEYETIPNCCGNTIKESIENGKAGNKCTCPQDYGTCEGRPQLQAGSRTYDAQYLRQFCENDQCVLGVPQEEVRPLTLLDERDFQFFKLETTANYNDPFDVAKDTFRFRFAILDDHEDVIFPIKISKILLTDGEVVIGERELSTLLGGVGDSATINVPVAHKLAQPEETRSLTFKINYEFEKRVKVGRFPNGSTEYETVLERNDYQNRFSTRVNFVRTGIE